MSRYGRVPPSPQGSLSINGVWPSNRQTGGYHSHMVGATFFYISILCKKNLVVTGLQVLVISGRGCSVNNVFIIIEFLFAVRYLVKA